MQGEGGGLRGGVLDVVTQCLLLLTGMHHSYTTRAVSLVGARGGGVERGEARGRGAYGVFLQGEGGGDGEFLVVVMLSAPADRDPSQLDYSIHHAAGEQ